MILNGIRWPLGRGASRLRGSSSSLTPAFYVCHEIVLQRWFFVFSHFVSSKRSIFHLSCLMFQGSWLMVKGLRIFQLGLRIWDDPRIILRSHQISSHSPGHQKSLKLVPKPSKIMKSGTWNHENSNFCES